jgi:cell division septation protein DedD
MTRRDYVDEVPVLTRTQRRLERRQMGMMVILMAAVTVASFFLGVMVGERSASVPSAGSTGSATAQVAPPPPPSGVANAPHKLTFYDDLPKGNAAPLGSGINLPKGGYVVPPPPPPVAAPAAGAAPAPVAPPVSAPVAPAVSPPPTVKTAAPKASSSGAYVVQVISTKNEAEARKIIGKLQGAGVTVHQERADLGAKGVWYRVVAGPYADQAAASQAAEKIKKQKFAAIVRKK